MLLVVKTEVNQKARAYYRDLFSFVGLPFLIAFSRHEDGDCGKVLFLIGVIVKHHNVFNLRLHRLHQPAERVGIVQTRVP